MNEEPPLPTNHTMLEVGQMTTEGDLYWKPTSQVWVLAQSIGLVLNKRHKERGVFYCRLVEVKVEEFTF